MSTFTAHVPPMHAAHGVRLYSQPHPQPKAADPATVEHDDGFDDWRYR